MITRSRTRAKRRFEAGIGHMLAALARRGLCAAVGGHLPGRAEINAALRRSHARPAVRRLAPA